jgi:hypothetical protein
MRLPKTAAPSSLPQINRKETVHTRSFPREICFAFSALFFVLTLIVMFRSVDPFGVESVIAYISCLTLTIILFSAPFVASYFINFNRKLRQIEDALLLLSSTRAEPLLPEQARMLAQSLAMSYLEVSPLEEDDRGGNAVDEVSVATRFPGPDAPVPVPMVKGEGDLASVSETPVIEKGKRKSPVKSREVAPDEDEAQLSLFAEGFESESSAVTALPEAETGPAPSVAVEAPEILIRVYALLESGVDLLLFGEEPLSWKEGQILRQVEVGVFEGLVQAAKGEVVIAFARSTAPKQRTQRCTVVRDGVNEFYPEW